MSGFLDRVKTLTVRSVDSSLLFLLGSGASRQSGIKTAGEMVADWMEILRKEDPDHETVEKGRWATAGRLELPGFNPDDPAAFYPQIFARTYRGRRSDGFDYLEAEVAGRDPSFGYSVLAQILESTKHKVVVTTNYDNLVTDALAIYTTATALVCGHESLGGFIRRHPSRPEIVRVHQDLFYAPRHAGEAPGALQEQFAGSLKELFEAHIPVVIGYGGNDGGLMNVLNDRHLELQHGIYWCYLRGGPRPRQEILDMIGRHHGWLVPIDGFDELMIRMQDTLGLGSLDDFLKKRGDERAARYLDHREVLGRSLTMGPTGETVPAERLLLAEPPPVVAARRDSPPVPGAPRVERRRTPEEWNDLAMRETDPSKLAEIYEEGLRALPQSAWMAEYAALFFEGTEATEQRAEELHLRAVALAESDGGVLTNYANFLTDVRRDHDAAEALYQRALEADPNRIGTLGNYANFLRNVRQDIDGAEALYQRVLNIDPNRPSTLGNYALLLADDRQEYDAAEALYERALQTDPNHANHLCNYANFLTNIRQDHTAAEALYKRALEVDPGHADCARDYTNFLANVRRDSAEPDLFGTRPTVIDPTNVNEFGF